MAVADYFLKLDGIDGETKQVGHEKEIELISYGFTEANATTYNSGGGFAGKVSMQDFRFTMLVNKASPKLFEYCATGKHVPKARLTCRKAGKTQQEFLKIAFTDCLVSSYARSGQADSSVIPVDQITLNFAKIEIEYAEQGADGKLLPSVKAGYDLKLGAKT
jgi:type VI secretion system secreted protein Hcp